MTGELGRDQPCYIISVAARLVGLHPQTLRYYESLGLVKPQRSSGNKRLYSPGDIERLQRIQRLVDERGVNLAGAEAILELMEKLERLESEMQEMHERHQRELESLRSKMKG